MNRIEFLRILREALEMSVDQDVIKEQIDYYDKYISDEISKGRTEQEVIEELGDPRLIAKTIKTINNTKDMKADNVSGDNQNYGNGSSSHRNYGNAESGSNRKYSTYIDDTGIGCVIVGLVAFVIISLIFRMFGYMVYGLGSLAFSGPLGFIVALGLLYLIFGRGGRRF